MSIVIEKIDIAEAAILEIQKVLDVEIKKANAAERRFVDLTKQLRQKTEEGSLTPRRQGRLETEVETAKHSLEAANKRLDRKLRETGKPLTDKTIEYVQRGGSLEELARKAFPDDETLQKRFIKEIGDMIKRYRKMIGE